MLSSNVIVLQVNEEAAMGYKEDLTILRKAGFSEAQMHFLSELRRNLAAEGKHLELIDVDYRRLQFARWLVTTGKLTEKIV
jgi:hypothetical protein